MKKNEAKAGIQRLARRWIQEAGVVIRSGQPANYYAFKDWAERNGHGHYWADFVYETMPERWFDEALGQTDWS